MTVMAAGLLAALGTVQSAQAANVKITPLGGVDGEFCILDRAMVFEDPDGTRVLYDPGRTVAGPNDPRLGKIGAILVSHMHGDHVGDRHTKAVNASKCNKPEFSVVAVPNTNTVNIALAKGSKIVTGSEMPKFFATKLKALGGNPKNSILARFGATKKVGGVSISTVPALHFNSVNPAMIGGAWRLCWPSDRLYPAVQQRTGRLSLGRHRHHGRTGRVGARLLQGQSGGDQHR